MRQGATCLFYQDGRSIGFAPSSTVFGVIGRLMLATDVVWTWRQFLFIHSRGVMGQAFRRRV